MVSRRLSTESAGHPQVAPVSARAKTLTLSEFASLAVSSGRRYGNMSVRRSAPLTESPLVVASSVVAPLAVASSADEPKPISIWVHAVGPLAFLMLMVMRDHGLVAHAPVWSYCVAIFGSAIINKIIEGWRGVETGTWKLHVRSFCHVAAVTGTIYVSGWGPALGMAFLFSAQIDLDQLGALAWRPVLGWSVVGCATGQLLIFLELAPSLLKPSHAQTVGFLGAFVFAIAIRKAGETCEYKERTQAIIDQQAIQDTLAREALELSEAHHRAVVENAAEGIVTFGLDGTIRAFNNAAETMFGWRASEIVGRQLTAILPLELHGFLVEFCDAYRNEGPDAVSRHGVEIDALRRDGTRFPIMIATSAIKVDGSEGLISGLVRDLSQQKHFEEQLSHQATHDSLTGLPNRVMLQDRLDLALARARRNELMLGVLFIDLDRFKYVNDKLGHTAGDQLLVDAANRIGSVVRDTDTVARIGGDEFVVLCESNESVRDISDVAQRIVEAIERPFQLGETAEHEAYVSASIGIALSVHGQESSDDMLRKADTAMYRAKDGGRGRAELFDDAMQDWVSNRLETETALRRALVNDEFVLHYQPVVDVSTGQVASFEALIRWDRPEHGIVEPSEFITIAEETGMMREIGEWVLRESCREAADWSRRWPERCLGIAVNVSSRQLLGGAIVNVVVDALNAAGLDPALLTLELTESTLIDDAVSAAQQLGALRDLGVNVALDDFGTGYSSLTYLRNFPINIIKVDRSFVRTLGTDHDDTAIVAGVISLARNLNLKVVAEGIETHEQLATLIMLSCDYVQGYLFSPACAASEIAALVLGPTLGARIEAIAS